MKLVYENKFPSFGHINLPDTELAEAMHPLNPVLSAWTGSDIFSH